VCVCVCVCVFVNVYCTTSPGGYTIEVNIYILSFIILHPQMSKSRIILYHKFYVVSEFLSLLNLYIFPALSTYSPCADHDGI